jgi:uncharacterized protein
MSSLPVVVDPDLADEVVTFLRMHPSFLADNPDLYRVLTPPVRVHGEALADHMAAMIRAERAQSAEMAARADGAVAAGRAALGLTSRVQEAVLALIASDDPAEWVESELPGWLGLDAAKLCVETYRPSMRRLPAGMIARLLGKRDVVFRERPGDAPLIHAEAASLARRDALVRVPSQSGGTGALLALAARGRLALEPGQGVAALSFLGRALGAALRF